MTRSLVTLAAAGTLVLAAVPAPAKADGGVIAASIIGGVAVGGILAGAATEPRVVYGAPAYYSSYPTRAYAAASVYVPEPVAYRVPAHWPYYITAPVYAAEPRYVVPTGASAALAVDGFPGYYTPPPLYRRYYGSPPACYEARVRIGGAWRATQMCF